MEVFNTKLSGVKILSPRVYRDERGSFCESFNLAHFCECIAESVDFVQDNYSRSLKGVLRGLHYQVSPRSQGKLVWAINGEAYDVVVDLRLDSPTYGEWMGVTLSSENAYQLWIPPGFAHGFYVVSDVLDLMYKTTKYYSPEHERSILWNDSTLSIDWPLIAPPILSPKDANASPFSSSVKP